MPSRFMHTDVQTLKSRYITSDGTDRTSRHSETTYPGMYNYPWVCVGVCRRQWAIRALLKKVCITSIPSNNEHIAHRQTNARWRLHCLSGRWGKQPSQIVPRWHRKATVWCQTRKYGFVFMCCVVCSTDIVVSGDNKQNQNYIFILFKTCFRFIALYGVCFQKSMYLYFL